VRNRRRPFIHILAALARTTILVLLSALPAWGAEPASSSLPVRIHYETGAACANPREFRDAVRQRAPELVDAGMHEAAREFNVGVTLGPDGVMRGKVEIVEPSGANVTRRLEGRDCAEVVEALAFIVAELGRAVSIEGEADAPADPDRAPTAPKPAPPSSRQAAKLALEEDTTPEPARWRVQAGVGLQALSALMPDWALGQLIYAELDRTRAGLPSAVAARLSASRAASGTIRGAIGDAEMLWLSLRGEACVRFGREPFWASPCATFDVGWLDATGSRAANSTTKRAAWLSPGLTARVTLVALKFLVLEPEAGVFVPLSRPRLFFGGPESEGETIHRVGAVGFRAGLAVGVLFP
jgi:hypothetical protein